MKTLPKRVKFIKYHWRHCAVFDPSNNNKHLYEAAQSFGAEHAAAITGKTLVSPEQQCKTWLKAHNFKLETEEANQREVWVQS